MKAYSERHQYGTIYIENKNILLNPDKPHSEHFESDIGIQIARDGRIWVCINGTAFVRFLPKRSTTLKTSS